MRSLHFSLTGAAFIGLYAVLSLTLFAQTYYPQCSETGQTDGPLLKIAVYGTPYPGYFLPSTAFYEQTGEYIHSLVIVVRFPDDTVLNANWPTSVNLVPDYISHLVTSDPDSVVLGGGSGNNISDFFYKNSYHKMMLTGEVFYITLNRGQD